MSGYGSSEAVLLDLEGLYDTPTRDKSARPYLLDFTFSCKVGVGGYARYRVRKPVSERRQAHLMKAGLITQVCARYYVRVHILILQILMTLQSFPDGLRIYG